MENRPEKFEESKPETMTFEEYAEIRHETPYVFEAENGEKKITYYGAGHSQHPEDPMFGEIEKKFHEADPDIVFVEGWDKLEELKPMVIKKFKEADREKIIKEFGEPGFTIKLAVEAGVEMESPEPKFGDEINHLLDLGFGKDEVFAYYTYRQITQYYRTPDAPALEVYLEPFFQKNFSKAAQWKDFDYSLSHLKEIGKKIFGKRGDVNNSEYAVEWSDPTIWPEMKARQTVVNEIARQSTYYRDSYMIQRVLEVMKEKNRLFVVFGASHAVMQESAIRKILSENGE